MTLYYSDGQMDLYAGSALEVQLHLPSQLAHCAVTSPPYWRQRKYAGGDLEIGIEALPEQWVSKLVDVFRETRRVLTPDGSLWLNVGDKFAASGMGGGGMASRRSNWRGTMGDVGWREPPVGFKKKDIALTPFRLAEALRQDGWYLRQVIVWSKPVAVEPPRLDRPSSSHEYVFLFTVNEESRCRNYEAYPWWHQSVWTISSDQDGQHVAMMPCELAARCILAGSQVGDTVIDPFCGSGTTCFVAKKLGRRSIGIDLSETYLKGAARRCAQLGLFL